MGRGWAQVFAAVVLVGASVLAGERDYKGFFVIRVVDEQTGRGVPLVELKTTDEVRYYTDSNGIVAFDEPGLLGKRVFFYVKSDGYEFAADGFGLRGVALETKANAEATLKIKRVNIAERLYRITGHGIYAESERAGIAPPVQGISANGMVMGQDSVQLTEYRGKLFWLWGDTNRAAYGLGNYGTSGATSARPAEGLDPNLGIALNYFVDKAGFSRPMAAVKGEGVKWLDGLVTLGAGAEEKLIVRFIRSKGMEETYERGWLQYNETTQSFEPFAVWPLKEFWIPVCHAWREKVDGQEYVYFSWPYAHLRVKAELAAVGNLAEYEAYTPLATGTRFKKKETQLERDPDGKLVWAWKKNTAPLLVEQEQELAGAGLIKGPERAYQFKDTASGKSVRAHAGSVAWNAFRKKWVMIFHAHGGSPSFLGEVYYAESERLEGPWTQATKVVTHAKYTFYNVKHHPQFDAEGGRKMYFEGTYTATFSGAQDVTPRYEYNQVMYRLDLSDPRLKLEK